MVACLAARPRMVRAEARRPADRASLRRRRQQWITLAGASKRALVLGSHLDSVPNGGWLDGCLGVLTGLEDPHASRTRVQRPAALSPSSSSIGPTKRARASAAVSSVPPPLPEPRPSTPTALAPTATASPLKPHSQPAASTIDRVGDAAVEPKEPRRLSRTPHRAGPDSRAPRQSARRRAGHQRRRAPRHHLPRPGGALRLNPHGRPPRRARCRRKARTRNPPHRTQASDAVCTMGSVKTFPGIVTAVVGRCEATLDQRDLDRQRSCADVPRSPRRQRTLRRRRTLHRRVVEHLVHRAHPVPSRTHRLCDEADSRNRRRQLEQPSLRSAARCRRGCPRSAFQP